jgi:hypothetical protein
MADEQPQPVEVAVALSHLEVIRAALNSAYHKGMAEDLADQYRKLSNRQQYSALTKSLEGTLAMVEDYIEVGFPQMIGTNDS